MFDYYGSMDRYYGNIDNSGESPDVPKRGISHPIDVSGLTPMEVGTSTNPMMHQVQAFAAKIREGASRIELSFLGAGKSNSQQPSPEAFGAKEREDIRAMAKMNDIQTSVHAALHGESLAGLGREGFSGEARQHALKEIERAIQFSAEATRGGAIVFHTGEWMRPMSEIEQKDGKPMFMAHRDEQDKAPKIVVDKRTGEITGVRKDHKVYEPKFLTASEYEKEYNSRIVGKTDTHGEVVDANDWVDIDGNAIKREWVLMPEKADQVFNRVPVWSKEKAKFETVEVEFKDYEKQAEDLRKKGGQFADITAEELFYKANTANQVLQLKGQSLYHAQQYDEIKRAWLAAKKAREFYEKLEKEVPKEEQWQLMRQDRELQGLIGEFAPTESKLPSEFLKDRMDSLNDRMRHIHESSASYDAQATQALERMNNFVSIEKYGLDMTAQTIAKAGLMAREYWKAHEKDLPEKIFVAPENFRPEQYGSHPEEIRKIITRSREEMAKELVDKNGLSEEAAKEAAKDHIRATIDIGHFNLWRQHFVREKGESTESRDKRFNEWVIKEMDKLGAEGMIGHLHITDNFGFDDEHLTPGQGNTPIKDFVKVMEKHGIKDFIVEAGSYNGSTVMQDTWALLGSPVYGVGGAPQPRSFRGIRDQHFGYHNPSFYIAGAYSPSNEWKLWSEIPLE
jgi:hypothetical protein